MLYQYKEITIVRIKDYVPEGMTLEEHLDIVEREALPVTISFDPTNTHDKEAKCATLPTGEVLGLVNSDSHRYIKAMMEKNDRHTCAGQFVEVVRREGHTPVIVYKVLINLEEVEKLKAGEDWNLWDTDLPVCSHFGDMDSVHRLATLLTNDFLTGEDKPYYTVLIEKLEKASLYDMSVETTIAYDDICFLLESNRTANMKIYKNLLQHATTVRRTDRMRKSFVEKWWPEVLESDPIVGMWNEYMKTLCVQNKIKADGKISQKLVKAELERIDENLKRLPYKLYFSIGNVADLFSGMFYTKIPRQKQKKLLSVMALKYKLEEIQDKKSIRVNNLFVNGGVSFGSANIGDVLNDNAMKIVK